MLELRTEPFIDYIISRALINGLMNATINNTQINFLFSIKGISWNCRQWNHGVVNEFLGIWRFIYQKRISFIQPAISLCFPTCLVKNHSIIKFRSILIHCKSKSIRNFHWNVESVSQSSALGKYTHWTWNVKR